MCPLKVLCLHGRGQSGMMFRRKTGAFRSKLSSLIDMHFVTAPFPLDNPEDFFYKLSPPKEDDPIFMWWDALGPKEHNAYDPASPIAYKEYKGLEESAELIRTTVRNEGPFMGILGFSQGGVMTSMLANSSEGFKFAILICAFAPGADNSMEMYNKCIQNETLRIPTLHIYGSDDRMIHKERCLGLAGDYGAVPCETPEEVIKVLTENPKGSVSYDHKGGHVVPTTPESRAIIEAFLAMVKKNFQLDTPEVAKF